MKGENQMKKYAEHVFVFLRRFHPLERLNLYLDDILIFGGLACIVGATFLLSKIIGLYVLGFCLLLLGIFVATHPSEGR